MLADVFPKYLVLKCTNIQELTAVMKLDVSLPLPHVKVTTDLTELAFDKDFTKVTSSTENVEFEGIEEPNLVIDEPLEDMRDSPNLHVSPTPHSPVVVKEEIMSPVKEDYSVTTTAYNQQEQFRRAFQNDHCYTKEVKDEPDEFRMLEEIAHFPVAEPISSLNKLNIQQRTPIYDLSNQIINIENIRMRYQRKKGNDSTNGKKHSLYTSVDCKLCHTSIAVKGKDWHAKSAHAIIHTNIERYHCPICELYGSRHRAEVVRHIQRVHELTGSGISIKEDMSPEDILRLRNMVTLCFGTEMNKRGKLQTQLMNFYEQQLDENKKVMV